MTKAIPTALHHTAFLVRDLEGAAQRFADSLGIGPWNIWTITPTVCRVHGQASPFSFRVALATVGGGTFELIAPHSGRSVLDEHLEAHGEGFHHTCLMYPSLGAVREAKAELQRQGRELVQEGSAGDAFDFGYYRFPEIGSLLEVLYLDPSKLPAPEVVIRPSMSQAELTEFGTRYAASWSTQDPAVVASFYAEDGSLTVNDGPPSVGRTAIAATAKAYMTAFPDMVVKMTEISGKGGHAIFHWLWTGTNTGAGGTGKCVRMTGYEEWTIDAAGRIAESKGHYDEAEYQRQLRVGVPRQP